MTAYKLFKRSGVSQCTISKILNMKIAKLTLKTIMDLSQSFGIELSEFFNSPTLRLENTVDRGEILTSIAKIPKKNC